MKKTWPKGVIVVKYDRLITEIVSYILVEGL